MNALVAFIIGVLVGVSILVVVALRYARAKVCEVCGKDIEKLSCYAQCGHRQCELEEHLQ